MAFLNPNDQKSQFPPHPSDVFQGYIQTRPSLIYASPRIIEAWAKDHEKLSVLKSMTVTTAGKLLNKKVGDLLVQNGVRINVGFGSTETGSICMMSCDQGSDWEYFYAPPVPEFHFMERPNFNGLYGLVVLSSRRRNLSVCNMTYNGTASYDTGDLFEKHPIKPNYYKVIGRISDHIMLSTGEVINPIPIEEAISEKLGVSMVVVFGHGRPSVGAIIQYAPHMAIDYDKSKTLTISNILANIVDVNSTLPSSARLTPKMVIVASPSKPLLLSPKGMPLRTQAFKDYEEEIMAVYS
ncbi:hypothetical protein F5050DRAFT_1813316 [Lentinula boryana]|uniref:AMP-dependent synthetase/ligase domain-containing protein n=1 Tax=Lentinula boryana TaxID=40481 RepID=A0ABQ8PWV2_9AGAR|nr:hypothetical protein F5050DRAFT_1813316 [Lentinula boryana]